MVGLEVSRVGTLTKDMTTEEGSSKQELKTVRWNGKAVTKGNAARTGVVLLGLLCLGGVVACAVPGAMYNLRGLYAPAIVLGLVGSALLISAMPLDSRSSPSNDDCDAATACCLCGLLTFLFAAAVSDSHSRRISVRG